VAKTADKRGTIVVPTDVDRGYLHGGMLYARRTEKRGKGKSESSRKKTKMKVLRPPEGGWKGTSHGGTVAEINK